MAKLPIDVLLDNLNPHNRGLNLVVLANVVNILALLLGRLLQGAGAIGAVVTAMISDVVREEQRPKAMAIMGGTIAASFAVAMIAGPTIGAYFGIHSLFWITAFLALLSIYILVAKVPNPPQVTHTYHNHSKISFLLNPELIKMNITNFLQKGMMTFAFMIIPIILTKQFGWEMFDLWKIYLPAMIAGVFAMGPAAMLAEKRGMFKQVLLIGILFFAISYYLIGNATSETLFLAGVIVFFIGFNMHEPIMQSLTTRYTKVHEKGKVLGVFNSFGYFGTFIGGFVGGLYLKEVDGSFMQSLYDISLVIVIVSIAWLALIATLPNPLKKKIAYLKLNETNKSNHNKLDNLNGCDEWYINNTEQIIIDKYDDDITSEDVIKDILK